MTLLEQLKYKIENFKQTSSVKEGLEIHDYVIKFSDEELNNFISNACGMINSIVNNIWITIPEYLYISAATVEMLKYLILNRITDSKLVEQLTNFISVENKYILDVTALLKKNTQMHWFNYYQPQWVPEWVVDSPNFQLEPLAPIQFEPLVPIEWIKPSLPQWVYDGYYYNTTDCKVIYGQTMDCFTDFPVTFPDAT
jgi:hypothetical protein